MSERMTVAFAVADADTEERLIREYIGPAFDRIEGRDDAR